MDWGWIDELDGTEAADELAGVRELLTTAECTQFLLAAHWADLHAPDLVADTRRGLPGLSRAVPAGPDGCPEVDESASAELAALLGRSTASGTQLLRDAVTVRHRHPLAWAAVKSGALRPWLATQVARRCANAGLLHGQAEWVDAATTPYAGTLPVKRFLDLVDAKIIEVDPLAAEARATARSLARFVHSGRTDEHGLRTLVARAHAGDVLYLVAVLDRIAVVLGEQGDPDPADARRATALRVLANPARALALLTGATLDRLDPTREHPDEVEAETCFPGGARGWMVDSAGRPLPGTGECADVDDEPLPLGLTPGAALVDASPPEPQDHGDPRLLRDLLGRLDRFAKGRLDPLVVLHVHLTETALAAGRGVARCEETGPAVLSTVRDWLSHPTSPDHVRTQVRVRPVLDASAVVPVDRYEVPTALTELVTARTPYEVFPFGTLPTRSADLDHVIPYGPQRGTTSLANLAGLSRRHHRLKTHGGWQVHHSEPGVYWWRTPTGHWFRVDSSGTHHHGRDPDLSLRRLSG